MAHTFDGVVEVIADALRAAALAECAAYFRSCGYGQ